MKIGIICPTKNELCPVLSAMKRVGASTCAMLEFHRGELEGRDVVAVASGMGKVNAAIATQVLIDSFDISHIVVAGVAGGIDSGLAIGDTVICEEVAHHDVDDMILTRFHPFLPGACMKADGRLLEDMKRATEGREFKQKIFFGRMVTGEAFIADEGRREIITKYEPLCVDMETAAVAQVCYAGGVPFIAIRSVTDTESESGMENFEKNCASASQNTFEVLRAFLKAVS